MSLSSKSSFRKKILQQRQEIPLPEWHYKSSLISENLQSWSVFQAAEIVLSYFAFRQEVDLSSLISFDKKWAFPRCVDHSLVWHLWQPGNSLATDRYGIQTPQEIAPQLNPKQADLILVPCVACDQDGYRLGYGGGFYDRFFSSLEVSVIPKIGVVFDFALVPKLPRDLWDIPLDFVCTETQFLTITKH